MLTSGIMETGQYSWNSDSGYMQPNIPNYPLHYAPPSDFVNDNFNYMPREQPERPRIKKKNWVVQRMDIINPLCFTDISPECCMNNLAIENRATACDIFRRFTDISPEVKEMAKNKEFNQVFTSALYEINCFLDRNNIAYTINAKVEEDIEFPEWKDVVVSVKIQQNNPERVFQIWETIEENIENRMSKLKDETGAIKEKYEKLVVVVEE